MTVINAFVQGGKGYLYTDTAVLHGGDGPDREEVVAFGSKAFTCANFPAVMAASYVGGSLPWLIDRYVANPPKNVKALVRSIPEACRAHVEMAREHGCEDPFTQLITMAWCARTRKVRIFFCSSSDSDYGPAYAVTEMQYFFTVGIAPEVQEVVRKLHAGEPVDTGADIITMMDAQRYAPFVSDAPGYCGIKCIGGAIEQLVVSKNYVEGDTLHQWPDEVGRPIAA